MRETPVLLLVHGSWHGPWCWEKLTPELDRLAIRHATVSLPSVGDAQPLGTVADDAAAVEKAAGAIAGDVIVVAHSYAGVPATEARYGANVKHLVYLGAFMPDAGQSLVDLLPPGPLPPFVVGHEDGTTSVAPELAIATFYADVDPATAAWAVKHLRRHNGVNNVMPVTRAAWRELASTYILLTEDFACPTIVQRAVVKQAGEARELKGSHSPFLAQPATLAAMLAEIATSRAGSTLQAAG
jgi:pimeloyl-ACP methyl ester carboxylesterase